jgi:hypothetical protein
MRALVRRSIFAVCLLLPSLSHAQDPRDYEAGSFLPSGTTIIHTYLRHTSSMVGRDVSAQQFLMRATYILKLGDWVLAPFDAILPIANANLYTPLNALPGLMAVPSDLRLTAHATGVGDPIYLPTIGSGVVENADNRTQTWYALTVYVTAPLGQYDRTRLLNIGTNRWTINPLIMVGQRFARVLTVELMANAAMYTANSEYRVPGNPMLAGRDLKLSQKPSFGAAAHVGVDLHASFWVGLAYLLAVNGERSFAVGGTDITETESWTAHTFRLTFGMRVAPTSQIIAQWSEDLAVSDVPNATRGRYFGLRFVHALVPPQAAAPTPAAK